MTSRLIFIIYKVGVTLLSLDLDGLMGAHPQKLTRENSRLLSNVYYYLMPGGGGATIIPSQIDFFDEFCNFFFKGLYTYLKGKIPKFQAPSFKTQPLIIFGKFCNFDENPLKSSKMSILLFGKRGSRNSSGRHD